MDPRQAQEQRESILRECRTLINSKFQGGGETLDANSQVALQQLSHSLAATRSDLVQIQSTVGTLSANDQAFSTELSSLRQGLSDLDLRASQSFKFVSSEVTQISSRLTSDPTAKTVDALNGDLAKVVIQVQELKAVTAELKRNTEILSAHNPSAPVPIHSAQSAAPSLDPNASAVENSGEVLRLTREVGQAAGSAQRAQARVLQVEEQIKALTVQVEGLLGAPPLVNAANQAPVLADNAGQRVQRIEEIITVLQEMQRKQGETVDGLRSVVANHQPFDSSVLEGRLGKIESRLLEIVALAASQDSVNQRLSQNEVFLNQLQTRVVGVENSMGTLANLAAARTELEALHKRIQDLEARFPSQAPLLQQSLPSPLQPSQPLQQPIAQPTQPPAPQPLGVQQSIAVAPAIFGLGQILGGGAPQ